MTSQSHDGLPPPGSSVFPTALPYDAVLFDMDGVVTQTANLHAEAWKKLFDAVLFDPRSGLGDDTPPFDPIEDYRLHVDGRSRADGIRAFLASRGVQMPEGSPDDPSDAWTVAGLASRKNELFHVALARNGVSAFPGTIALLERLRAGGIAVGLVTASRNADALLADLQLEAAFDVIVDGKVAEEQGLSGKPDPAMFLAAAKRLGVAPKHVAVLEDAVSGVQAARNGGFGLVVGIDRTGDRAQLETAGADIVLTDVSQLDLGASRTDPWKLIYEGFDPEHEGHREALTALGNGYMVTRGTRPERRDDGTHYPGTYLAGIYNRSATIIHGRELEEEHLVNVPNWLPVDIRIGDGPWWSTGDVNVLTDLTELDLRHGVLTRRATLIGPKGEHLALKQRRIVSMHNPHLAALETTLTAQGFSGTVGVRTGIDARVANANVRDYVGAGGSHLTEASFSEPDPFTVLCDVQTTQSKIRLAIAVRTLVEGSREAVNRQTQNDLGQHIKHLDLRLIDGQTATITKTVALVTSRDPAISSPADAALTQLSQNPGGFRILLQDHQTAWCRLWDLFGMSFDGDRQSRLVLNVHVFHLLQSISMHTADLDAGVPARGLHGEGYRGHIFWDELFVLPVIGLRLPQVNRALLEYRWRRLRAARVAAQAQGLSGALFPWQSGSDGREETPRSLYNPLSKRWMPDNSSLQRHVGLAVAYNAWQYFQATGDKSWLAERGAELIVEVTRFFASLVTFDVSTGKHHLAGVMGPDEYHDGYPDKPGAGLKDNAYNNVLLSWVCERACQVLQELEGHLSLSVIDRLQITPEEIRHWSELARTLSVSFHDDGIISQFDGYGDLIEFDWQRYREKYGNIGRLDLILEAENDTTNRYKVSKQADVLMLIYLLGPAGVVKRLNRLGYPFTENDLQRTVHYYISRTSDGSTLSRVVHTSVLSRFDESHAWTLFREALLADLDDTQGGTTREGIHLGAMSGTVDIVIRSFAGLQVEGDALRFSPNLPISLGKVGFRIQYRGHLIDVSLSTKCLSIRLQPSTAPPIEVGAGEIFVTLAGGEEKRFPLKRDDNDAGSDADSPSQTISRPGKAT